VIGYTLGGRFAGTALSGGLDFGATSLNISVDPNNFTPNGAELGFGPGSGGSLQRTTTTVLCNPFLISECR